MSDAAPLGTGNGRLTATDKGDCFCDAALAATGDGNICFCPGRLGAGNGFGPGRLAATGDGSCFWPWLLLVVGFVAKVCNPAKWKRSLTFVSLLDLEVADSPAAICIKSWTCGLHFNVPEEISFESLSSKFCLGDSPFDLWGCVVDSLLSGS